MEQRQGVVEYADEPDLAHVSSAEEKAGPSNHMASL